MRRNGRQKQKALIVILFVLMMLIAATFFFRQMKGNQQKKVTKALAAVTAWEDGHYQEINQSMTETGEVMAGTGSYDWYIFAMARAGAVLENGASAPFTLYLKQAEVYVEENIEQQNALLKEKPTEQQRVALAMLASGAEPEDHALAFLIQGGVSDCDTDRFLKQGIMADIYGLLLAAASNEKAATSVAVMTDRLLKQQTDEGGFGLAGQSDPDVTAMALQALAFWQSGNQEKQVTKAIEKALAYLSKVQRLDGSFGNADTGYAESTAQVVIALCSLGIDPQKDKRFIKKQSVIQALLQFQNEDGGFSHLRGEESDVIASVQALNGLTALERFRQGKPLLYEIREN